eukprot:6212364-Pyramimonas_sp.AAC.1
MGDHRTCKKLAVVPAASCNHSQSHRAPPGPLATHWPWLPHAVCSVRPRLRSSSVGQPSSARLACDGGELFLRHRQAEGGSAMAGRECGKTRLVGNCDPALAYARSVLEPPRL